MSEIRGRSLARKIAFVEEEARPDVAQAERITDVVSLIGGPAFRCRDELVLYPELVAGDLSAVSENEVAEIRYVAVDLIAGDDREQGQQKHLYVEISSPRTHPHASIPPKLYRSGHRVSYGWSRRDTEDR